jgi:hypothetical protein
MQVVMPVQAGKVTALLPVQLVKNVDASWIARGTKRDRLCYKAKNWKGARETVCKPIPHTRGLAGHRMTYKVSKDGAAML